MCYQVALQSPFWPECCSWAFRADKLTLCPSGVSEHSQRGRLSAVPLPSSACPCFLGASGPTCPPLPQDALCRNCSSLLWKGCCSLEELLVWPEGRNTRCQATSACGHFSTPHPVTNLVRNTGDPENSFTACFRWHALISADRNKDTLIAHSCDESLFFRRGENPLSLSWI